MKDQNDTIREPDFEQTVAVPGGNVRVYGYGQKNADNVILALNGGPGVPCDYIRDSHTFLADDGWCFVAFDQLGTGKSDNPPDSSLWTIARYSEEVDAVRKGLGVDKVHLLGQSWGGWLALEYACENTSRISSLVLEDTCADIPTLKLELDRLRSALGPETVHMMLAHEAAGTISHPEYQAAVTLLDYRHVCRLKERPSAFQRSLDGINNDIYNHMQGPNEFVYNGNLRNWSRLRDLHKIDVPVLIVVGKYDEITPVCAMQMHAEFRDSEIQVFDKSSHTPFFEEREEFQDRLIEFYVRLKRHGA